MKDKYNDLLNREYSPSKTHKHMNKLNRAAQFAPFAALTGYDTAILHASKLIIKEKILSEEMKEDIDEKLRILNKNNKHPLIKVTYYVDKDKYYESKISEFKKLDLNDKSMILSDNTRIKFNKIYKIESDIFDEFKVS